MPASLTLQTVYLNSSSDCPSSNFRPPVTIDFSLCYSFEKSTTLLAASGLCSSTATLFRGRICQKVLEFIRFVFVGHNLHLSLGLIFVWDTLILKREGEHSSLRICALPLDFRVRVEMRGYGVVGVTPPWPVSLIAFRSWLCSRNQDKAHRHPTFPDTRRVG